MKRFVITISVLIVGAVALRGQEPNPLWMRSGHTAQPQSIAFTGDSGYLLSGGIDGVVRVWDVRTLYLHKTIVIGAVVTSIAASADGGFAIAADNRGRLHIIASGSWRITRTVRPVESRANSVRISRNGEHAVVGYADNMARLIDLSTFEVVEQYVGHSAQITSVDISSDGARVATASDDFTTRTWQTRPAQLIATIQEVQRSSFAVAFSPDGRSVATLGYYETLPPEPAKGVVIFDVESGEPTRRVWAGFAKALVGLAWHPIGRYLAAATEDAAIPGTLLGSSLGVIDLVRGDHGWAWTGTEEIGWATGVAFSPDGNALAWSTSGGRIYMRRLRDTVFEEGIHQVTDHLQPVGALTLSPGDSVLYSGDDSGQVLVFRPISGERVDAFKAHTLAIRDIDISPDGEAVMTASVDGTVKIWRRDNTLQSVRYLSADWPVSCARFVDGSRVVVGISSFDSTVVLLDTSNNRPLRRYYGASLGINAIDVSADRTRLVAASEDGFARVWDIETGELLATTRAEHEQMRSVAFSRDGEVLFCGYIDGTVSMMDSRDGSEISALKAHAGEVTDLRVVASGELLASASLDSTIGLWTIAAESLLPHMRYHVHPAGINVLAASRTSTLLAAGADDATVLMLRAGQPAAAPRGGGSATDGTVALWFGGSAERPALFLRTSTSGPCTITLYDLLGRELHTIEREHLAAGTNVFHAETLTAGVIVARATVGAKSTSTVLVMAR